MKKVGFAGGGIIFEVGPVNDMLLFFECLRLICMKHQPSQDWSLLTDRLFKRYIRQEEGDEANRLMIRAQELFSEIDSRSINWSELSVDLTQSELDFSQETMADIFTNYFRGFFRCYKGAEFQYEQFKDKPNYLYECVRTATTDIPYYFDEESIPLSEYDALTDEDLPFWCHNP